MKNIRTDWIEALPETIEVPWQCQGYKGAIEYVIDKARKLVCLKDGREYLSLPEAPPVDISKWIADNEYIPVYVVDPFDFAERYGYIRR